MLIRRDGFESLKTPTLDTSAYASGDLLFDKVEITPVSLDPKGLGYLRTLFVIDSDNNKQAIDLLFFNEDPGTLGSLNAAVALSDAQAAKLVAMVSVATGDYVTLTGGSNAVAMKSLDILLPMKAKSRSIWMAGVCRSGTPTYAATGLTIKNIIERY